MERATTHVDGEFAANPDELPRVGLQFRYAAGMRLAHIDRIAPQVVDNGEIALEHVRVLVILGVNVLADRRREGKVRRPPKRQGKDVSERSFVRQGLEA